MKGLKQFGAMAMAAALTLTMVAPITANAQVTWTREKIGTEETEEGSEPATIYKYTYTNEDTKASETITQVGDPMEEVAMALVSKIKTVTIATQSYNETLVLETTKDVAKYEKFKSNKKNLKVKVLNIEEKTNKEGTLKEDFIDKDGKKCFRNVNGDIVRVDEMPKGASKGKYTLRFYAKKAGTYKVSYNAILQDGTTVKKTFKVIAKEDGKAIKSITFAGKNIYSNEDLKDKGNELWTKGFDGNTTTAKKGVIRVTMNKDFKLKKIEVGTPILVDDATYIKRRKEADNSLDTISPDLSEDIYSMEVTAYSWKKVKNGKKITLSNVDTSTADEEKAKEGESKIFKSETTRTFIRITYYDKKDKTTHRVVSFIDKVQK